MKIQYGQDYFETITQEPGVNSIRHNPFKLIDFSLLILKAGETFQISTESREYGIDMMSGIADITVENQTFTQCGGRKSVFDGRPTLVYAGPQSQVMITAHSDTQIGLGSAQSTIERDPYIIRPEQTQSGQWGEGNTVREYDFMLNAANPSERLFFAEVTVHNGNWATYPPHKHEANCPDEVFQEELYFYKVHPENGIGMCAQFGGQMKEDFAFPITDNTVHKQPHGYHTVTAAPGYSICYLAVFAGNDKQQKPFLHPDHKWQMADLEK